MARGSEKWAAKLSGDNRKLLYDRQKNFMARLEAKATRKLVQIEYEVKQICQGVLITHLPYYIIFAKELYRLRYHHSTTTLITEAEILEEKWRARGLNYGLLDTIKAYYIPSYETRQHFKLDISDLDGTHVLA